MFTFDERLTDLVLSYCRERLALDPVPLDYGGYDARSSSRLTNLIGPNGNDPEDVLDLFSRSLATSVVSVDSPRFLSFIPAAPTKAALLFDMVVSCSSLQGASWLLAAGSVAAENQALSVLTALVGLPPHAGGTFVSGGSAANLSALLVARETSLKGSAGGSAEHSQRPRVALTKEAHSSVAKAVHILGADPLVVDVPDHRLTGAALEAALDGAMADGKGPVMAVVGTGGTTNAGIVDDLAGIGQVARERGIWFHVDAAYGGAALFSPAEKERFMGIELADSVVIDPHKWLFAPYDCAALLYRDPPLAKAVHTQDAAYLSVFREAPPTPAPGQPPAGVAGGGTEPWNPADYAFHLSRRARGMPLWFSLAVNGTDAYREAVETALGMARSAAALIARTPYLELLREPELTVVLFARRGWVRSDYDAWSRRLLADQIALVVPTTWETQPAARMVLLHPDTTLAIVREVIESMA